ncbi:hypothetical protein BAUCODRAFT_136463 [Baudoinia panamericana UAMH 10762]|uniref:Zn(2)-C6 fungal-type domain-containing protein n=1 Tax=Baudoinia panamericana (strain UAMH 10762) TaxID=717646 RepID=M2N746_BAUPA|nr:uncharacterized protein BAUCODRAFT_136463 [Baudoinia panamericana UAMH 10762]EMC99923.1 hypothetical protein BAUCODRAFT_136463 [Baudoinia panamericana UAMH 10762]
MAIRRFHQKSRTGCSACKTRRVKCDERKPVCNNCIRRGTPCEWPTGVAQPPSPPPSVEAGRDEASYDALDLVLMHRFATVTALEMSPAAEAKHVWQNIIPVEAHSAPLLMHGILALAGLDLARIPSPTASTYRTRALHHQQLGLAMFQEMLVQDTATQMHAIFPFSLMLIIITLASAQEEAMQWSVDSIVNMFALYRGPRALAKSNWDTIRDSHLGALLSKGDAAEDPGVPEDLRTLLERLDRYCTDEVAIDAKKMIIADIERAGPALDLRAVGHWPAMVSDPFFARLKAQEPGALAVLSYYSLVLNAFRERWWVGNWGRMLLTAVDQAMPELEKKRLGWSADNIKSLLDVPRDI